MIRPLRDNIVARPLEPIGMAGALFMPENYKQNLLQHHKCVVIASGPKAQEVCPVGTVVHVKESWGEAVMHNGEKVWIGRIRDINGICEGELARTKFND